MSRSPSQKEFRSQRESMRTSRTCTMTDKNGRKTVVICDGSDHKSHDRREDE